MTDANTMVERLESNGRTVLFFRGSYFYPVIFTKRCRVEDHVALNPGTTKVMDALTGEVLWSIQ